MKMKMIRNAIWLAVPLVMLNFLSGHVYGYELEGDRALLDKVIASYRSNWEMVLTWQGAVEVLDTRVREKNTPTQVKWSSRSLFCYQAEPYALRWNWNVLDPEGERNGPKIVNGLHLDGKLTLLEVDLTTEGISKRTVRILPPERYKSGPSRRAFDPIYYSGYNGKNLADLFSFFHRNADELATDGWRVYEDKNLVTLECNTPQSMNRYTADLSLGGNLVLYESEDRKDTEVVSRLTWQASYEKNEGVWLPSKVTRKNEKYSKEKPGESGEKRQNSSSIRSVRWIVSIVNKPISEEEFTLKKIRLNPGDMIHNTFSGEVTEYGFSQSPDKTWEK